MVNALSSPLALNKLSLVFSFTKVPLLNSLASLYFVDVISVIETALGRVDKTALSVVKAIFPFTVVDVAVLVVHSALAVVKFILGETSIVITVGELNLSEAFVKLDVSLGSGLTKDNDQKDNAQTYLCPLYFEPDSVSAQVLSQM